MTLQSPAYVISAASHSAALFRQAFAANVQRQGVFGGNEYLVKQQTSPNMSVKINPGRVAVQGTQIAPPGGFPFSAQGMYLAFNDAGATMTIAAADPTNPRIDVVYVQVQDAFYAGSLNQANFGVATGVPSGTPAVPAIPANAISLAQVAIAANATSIVTANITTIAGLGPSIAAAVGGILPTSGSSQYPTLPYVGQYIDDPVSGLMRYDGSNWQKYGLGGDTGWVALPIGASFTGTAQMRLIGGTQVLMRYLIETISGSFTPSSAFNVISPGGLPSAYRPPAQMNWILSGSNVAAAVRCSVNGDGSVQFVTQATTGSYVDMTPVQYRVD